MAARTAGDAQLDPRGLCFGTYSPVGDGCVSVAVIGKMDMLNGSVRLPCEQTSLPVLQPDSPVRYMPISLLTTPMSMLVAGWVAVVVGAMDMPNGSVRLPSERLSLPALLMALPCGACLSLTNPAEDGAGEAEVNVMAGADSIPRERLSLPALQGPPAESRIYPDAHSAASIAAAVAAAVQAPVELAHARLGQEPRGGALASAAGEVHSDRA